MRRYGHALLPISRPGKCRLHATHQQRYLRRLQLLLQRQPQPRLQRRKPPRRPMRSNAGPLLCATAALRTTELMRAQAGSCLAVRTEPVQGPVAVVVAGAGTGMLMHLNTMV